MVCSALLSARSPPRLSRCRTVRPLLASSGLVPDSAANAASLRHPADVGKADNDLGGGDRADPAPLCQPGRHVLDDGLQLSPVVLQRASAIAYGQRESADLTVSHRLLTSGAGAGPSVGQLGQLGVGQDASGQIAVGVVVAAEQQRAQPVGLRGGGDGQVVAGAEQDPQRLAVAIDPRCR